MKFKVAVVGGGPSGSCAAEVLAACEDVDVTLFERKMDNAKPCGGAIPLCMIDEFDLPTSIIDRKVCMQPVVSVSIRCVSSRTLYLGPLHVFGQIRKWNDLLLH